MQKTVVESLKENYMPYSAHVILHRALPEIDGMKVSQRRILYTMYKMGLLKGNRKKSQGIVGQTMFLHPHGDGAIYEALVRLAKDNEALLVPYVDSKGNFGKQYSRDMKQASARYTEVRLESIAKELFKDIDKNTVDMIDNYDGTFKEPRLLPVTFPSVLVNPSQGTAVGMASSICSFNLSEVIDFITNFLKDRNTKVEDYIKAPDLPTGGDIIYDEKVFKNIYENGKGSFKIRSKYHFDGNSIIISEIPYTTTIEAIIDRIVELVKDNKIKDITDVNDIDGVNSKGIEITVKSNTDKELLMAKLFKMTPLEDTFSCNFNIIVDGRPKVLGVKDILIEWLKFRIKSIKRGKSFDIDKKSERKHLLSGLQKVLLDIEKAIEIIRNTKKNSEVINNLMEYFSLDIVQAEYIADIKLRNLNEEYIIDKANEIEKLTKEIDELNELIGSKKLLAQLIIDELQSIKKLYGKERKSGIINIDEVEVLDNKEIEVEDYNVKLFLTNAGYLKKVAATSLRGNSKQNLKDDDYIIQELDSSNRADILIFTDKYNTYKLKAHELSDTKLSNLGEFLPALLQLKDEKIVYVTATVDYKEDLLIGYESGKLARINIKAYYTKQNRKKLENTYNKDSQPLYWNTIKEDIDVGAISDIDKVIIMSTSNINAKSSKNTKGVTFQKSKSDSRVVKYFNMDQFECESADYYKVSSAGVGKYKKKEDKIIKIN
ncbi:DNA gyrase/topoisomerase IV subunit A [Priestia megaterium]|uniref:DNA gyrase/topoisomerase IV subunit A n=1 Tax=Priestia megaterium TaxID=1404 RepID=UPI00112E570F|nr:DNA topoisomerase (ATP-hydrolyzing) subunit A [Priestia megaterium]TPF18102.1 topoisomerase IV [Priestia megaterium]TPF22209.1 topoisomerase IV [Priestia megaterium]